MAYEEYYADRIRLALNQRKVSFREINMMGGYCVMVDDKMCIGLVKGHLMARVGPERYREALEEPGAKPMDFTGRPMKGFVFLEQGQIEEDEVLNKWLDWCLLYNPQAKSTKKR